MQHKHDSQQFLGVPLLPQPVSVMPEESQPTGSQQVSLLLQAPGSPGGPGRDGRGSPGNQSLGMNLGTREGLTPGPQLVAGIGVSKVRSRSAPSLFDPGHGGGRGPHFLLGEGIGSPPCWTIGKNPGGTASQCHKVLPRGPKASGLPGHKPARAASAPSTRELSGLGLVAQALWASVSQAIKWCPHRVFHRGCGRVPRGHTCKQPKAGRTPANIPLLLLLLR